MAGEIPHMVPVDLREDGLLWLINHTVFHPRGFALAVDENRNLYMLGDGTEPWTFMHAHIEDDEFFAALNRMFARVAAHNS